MTVNTANTRRGVEQVRFLDRPGPRTPGGTRGACAVEVPDALLQRARALARTSGASLLDVVSAALIVVVGRCTGQEDVTLGVTEVADPVGVFARLSDDPTFAELIARVAASRAEAEPGHDLSLTFHASADGLRLVIDHAGAFFAGRHLHNVLDAGVRTPDRPVSRLTLLDEDERTRLLKAGRGTGPSYGTSTGEPVHAAVLRTAAQAPHSVAAVCRGAKLTYGELARRSEALARRLRAQGLRPGQIVVIAMDRDLDILVAMVGVLRAGGAYTVTDPEWPVAKVEHVLRDTAAAFVVTRPELAVRLPAAPDTYVLPVDTDDAHAHAQADADADADEEAPAVDGASLAHVLYPTDEDGRGVLVDHRGLRTFVEAYRRCFGAFTADDRLLQAPALTTGLAQGEVYAALVTGATLVLVSPGDASSAPALAALMREQRVTYAGLSVPRLNQLDSGPYPHLRHLTGDGEVIPAELVNKWNIPGRKFVNIYGTAETGVASTRHLCAHVK